MDIFWLYLFVKLDEIRNFLMCSTVHWFAASVTIAAVVLLLLSWVIPDDNGEYYPFSGFLSTEHSYKPTLNRIVKVTKRYLTVVMVFTIISYTIGTFLPSVKQAAFVYVAHVATQSETLQNVPEDLARIISSAAHKYAEDLSKPEGSR